MHEVRGPQPHALASGEDGEEATVGVEVRELVVAPTCKRFGAQILSLGAATGGLAGGFEGAAAAAQEGKRVALGCVRGGRVVLPLARAAAVSTGLRVHPLRSIRQVDLVPG